VFGQVRLRAPAVAPLAVQSRWASTEAATDGQTGRKGVALLVAAARSHEQDRMDRPQPMLELGGVSMVHHALYQLNSAHFESVVVVTGFQGDEVQKSLQDHVAKEKDVFAGLNLEFVDLGKGWRGGRAASIAAAGPTIQKLAKASDVVVVGADHVFDAELLERAASVELSSSGDEACVLVETDIEGMVGLPSSTVFCAMRPLHGADRIYSIGNDIETYSGVEAGLTVLSPSTLQRVIDIKQKDGVTGLLSDIAKNGTLRMMKTEGQTWFNVSTEASAEHAAQGLSSKGQEYELSDGNKITLVGLPKKVAGGGGEWAEFSVDQWRSAVYTSRSFFEQLFVDTTNFIGSLCDELGGKSENGPLLVEVGCGTGEALLPLVDRAPFVVGMDFNPKFIEFCQQNVPEGHDNIKHIVGDAQELNALMERELDSKWTVASRPKIAMCVGNTVGILPPEIRKNTYQQMKEMAGKNGYMVVVYWNGNMFGEAVQHFYHKNPQLCGPFKGDSIDLNTCTLTTPSGYCTHWTTPEEARMIFEKEIGAEVVRIEEMGRGVLVAGRMRD